MERKTLILIVLMISASTFAQFDHLRVYSTFDNITLSQSDTFDNGASLHGGFNHFGRFFNNSYDPNWGSWSGWALSNSTDTLTPGFSNQYSAITGSGVSTTANYMVGTTGAYIRFDSATEISGAYFTNSTYAYLDMKFGSGFSKKFGGDNGTDPDYFRLIIRSYLSGSLVDSTLFYLADLRSSDTDEDHMVNDWVYVDFNDDPLNDIKVDSISFDFESSDNGQWGMNTPAYFCMDDLNAISQLPEPKGISNYDMLSKFAEDTFYNGSDEAGGFVLGYAFFSGEYDTQWGSWYGWGISSKFDDSTAGYQNQYSCVNNTQGNFLIASGTHVDMRAPYLPDSAVLSNPFLLQQPPPYPVRLMVTNSTYAYLDMLNGSSFSKKFGGVDGTEPDYFRLVVSYYDHTDIMVDRDTVYLADFRSEDPAGDYILDEWVTLPEHAPAHRVSFDLESSDNSSWGMNTPAYFCLKPTYVIPNHVDEFVTSQLLIYPNPATDHITLNTSENMTSISIYSANGQCVMSHELGIRSEKINVDIRNLESGLYFVEGITEQGRTIGRFVKP